MQHASACVNGANCCKFSAPQREYPLGGSSKKGSHVYFLLQVFWVILLFVINIVLVLPWWPDVTIVQSNDVTIVQCDITIVVPWQLSTGSKHDYLVCYCPLVGILFEVLRINLSMITSLSVDVDVISHLLEATLFSHGFSAVVAVSSSSIPISWHGFGVKGNHHSKVFCYTLQDEASHP